MILKYPLVQICPSKQLIKRKIFRFLNLLFLVPHKDLIEKRYLK